MRLALSALLVTALLAVSPARAEVRVVPEGNRNAEQPQVPGASARRTKAGKTTFDAKYEKVVGLLARDAKLMSKIKATARAYGIAPIHMIGAIVGEHTYNVDAYDRLQSYYVKAAGYLGDSFRFDYKGERVDDFVARPQFAECAGKKGSYALWTCRETVWERDFRARPWVASAIRTTVSSAVFFQPFYAARPSASGRSILSRH